ncbi:hypothetical protein W97_07244 [Coniosporium apollinis CBS 100218]|uniref:DUF3835 domain-containing protein n=1 Tax=Coniosporium apollinis (strain CBS 100218) TaxID=1168221 RepID=R7Z2H6_CONA1|nr:uncharacterized protein W97_07244 [Coniosporium apollinis CBS 100218]EON68096.1 hypothetical protein W97_07244 [Coniosporium apollinis CBS 100218]
MDQTTRDSLADLERRRLQLEESVVKLQLALRQWQTWDAEYEGLKEEILGFAGEPTTQDLVDIGTKFGGDLVNENEIRQLVGIDKGIQRSRTQVVDLISRRVDYVQQNVKTVQKQLGAAEEKLGQVLVISNPEMTDESGLPLAEIREELDEEGNVISSTTSDPTESQTRIIQALRNAGVTDLEKSTDMSMPSKPTQNQAASTFTKSQDSADDLAYGRFKPGSKVIELNDDDEVIGSTAIIPDDDSPEDAALRREMLEYGLSGVGSVVAELDLEDPDGQYSHSDDEFDDDYESDAEEEDEYGRSTRREVSDDYRRQMLELEKKLNARMLENVGPESEQNPLNDYAEDARRLVIRKANTDTEPDVPKNTEKPARKGVRFAEDLDISPAPEAASKAVESAATEALPRKPVVSDAVLERTTAAQPTVSEEPRRQKTSRFKSTRGTSAATSSQPVKTVPVHLTAAAPTLRTAPEGPAGRTLSSAVVERSAAEGEAEPPDPDGLDPALLQQEVATEYHKMRNRMIQRQGGFMPSEEEAEQDPLLEERDGKVKKVSRFKAARLGASSS